MQESLPLPSSGLAHIVNEHLIPEHLHALLALSLSPDTSLSQQLHDHLVTGCGLLGMKTGILGHAEANNYEITAAINPSPGREAGSECPLGATYCGAVVKHAACIAYPHISLMEGMTSHPAYQTMAFESYLAAPVWSEGRLTGTICFGDPSPRTHDFTPSECALVATLGVAVGQLMDRENEHQRLTTELKHVRATNQEMELLFSRCQLPMAMMDFHGHWTRLNSALSQLLGIEASELRRGSLEDISHPTDMIACRNALNAMREGELTHFHQRHRYRGRQGLMVEVMLNLDLVDGHSGIILSQHQDISEQLAHEESLVRLRHKLACLTKTHPTTSAPLDNLIPMPLLEQQLDNEIARSARHGQALSLLMLNVDAFIDFNRLFGRPAGDRALRQVASILRNATRKSDVVSQREDGTLIALLTSTDSSGAIILAERVRHAVNALDGLGKPITCSLGLTCYHPTPDTLSLAKQVDLMERAQHALKKAKRQGRDRVRFLDLDPAHLPESALVPGRLSTPRDNI